MTYKRFEDLPVWKEAIRLAKACEDSCHQYPFSLPKIPSVFQDQISNLKFEISNPQAP